MFKLSIQLSFGLFKKNKRNIVKESQKFLPLAIETIQMLAGVRAKSTIDNYQTALRSFCQYTGADLSVGCIDSHLIEGYQQWLLDNHVIHNTISCYMRSLRSLLHQIFPEMKRDPLFDRAFTGRTKTDKRSISFDEIVRIRELRLSPDSPLAFSRDVFLFSFYALGMPFVDIAFLQKSQIHDGYIIYQRHKTGQRIRIKIEPPMQQIISKYSVEESPYVFPILTSIDKGRAIHEYETARSLYNRHLKKIGAMSGVLRNLTSYVARHSWASLAYHSNVDLAVISKALGHTSPTTTLTYIREIDDNRIDMANRELLQRLMDK